MNEVLIDTDIISYYIKGDSEVTKNIESYLDYYDYLNISIVS